MVLAVLSACSHEDSNGAEGAPQSLGDLGTSTLDDSDAIDPAEADQHVGENTTVCGDVSSVGGGGADPVFLNFGGAYPNQEFTIVLWDETDPPGNLVGDALCATGPIVDYRGTPQIQLNTLDEVEQ